MNKDEFLRRLEDALSGEVPASVIRENLNYYADYLSQELGKGRTMDEMVMEALRMRPRGTMTEEALTAREVIRTAPRRISIISI